MDTVVPEAIAFGSVAVGGYALRYLLQLGCQKLLPVDIDAILQYISDLLRKIAASLGDAVQALAKIIVDDTPDAHGERRSFCEFELEVKNTDELQHEHDTYVRRPIVTIHLLMLRVDYSLSSRRSNESGTQPKRRHTTNRWASDSIYGSVSSHSRRAGKILAIPSGCV